MREQTPNLPGLWLGLIMRVSKVWLFCIFWLNICFFIYKGLTLPYPKTYLGLDIFYYVCWGITGMLRHAIGTRGVARFEPLALIFFFLSTLFAVFTQSLYFVRYQTFVLRIELIFNSFCISIEALEAILGIIAAILYMKAQKI